MKDKSLGLILFALRELQSNIQYAPNQILQCLLDDYDLKFESMYQLFNDLSELCEDLNCDDKNV